MESMGWKYYDNYTRCKREEFPVKSVKNINRLIREQWVYPKDFFTGTGSWMTTRIAHNVVGDRIILYHYQRLN